MKKIIYGLLILVSSILAADKAYVGGGPYIQTQPYRGDDVKVIPSPFILFDNGSFYARWMQFGAYFLGEKDDTSSWGLSVTVEPNPQGYSNDDSNTLKGMSDRDSSVNGGINLSAKNELGYADVSYVYDLFSNHKGKYARAQVGTTFVKDKWSFDPSLLLSWYDSDFSNYYYGVKQSEVTATRSFYSAKSSLNYGAQLYIMYDIKPNWHFLLNGRLDILDSEIKDSPIVHDSAIYSGTMSLLYSFEVK